METLLYHLHERCYRNHKIPLYHFRLIAPPKRVRSDRGTEFNQHITSRAYHPPSSREDWEITWDLENQTKIWYTQLCRMWHIFFVFYTNETNEINDYANVYIRIIYSERSI